MNAAACGTRRRPGAAWYRSARRRRRCSGASGPSRCRCSTTPRPDQARLARRGVPAGRARGVRDRPRGCVCHGRRRTSAPRRPGRRRVLRHWVPGVRTRRPTSCGTARHASAWPGPQWAPQGKATVLDVRPTESPLTCLPRSGLSSAHVSSRTRAFNRNKSPHVSRLRGRRSQRRGEVGSWNVSVVDAHQDRSSPKWPRAGRSLLFSKETRGCGQSAVHKI